VNNALYVPVHPVRFVTAAALFDGHDAAINVMRRLLQAQGAEVIHLGHDRSVRDVVDAAIEEDVQGVAISSYQGGHMEYFRYLLDQLRMEGRGDIKVYGGGGGVIVASEVAELEAYGLTRIFTPADGQELGLDGMINVLIRECDRDLAAGPQPSLDEVAGGHRAALARLITLLESGALPQGAAAGSLRVGELATQAAKRAVPVLGITGTGGSGKSSLTDELVRRFRLDQEDKLRIAVLAIDPTRRRRGGALLGDRIRMNSLSPPQVFFRSMATRQAGGELPVCMAQAIDACRVAGFDLVIVETPGIGQGDAAIVDVADVSLYVMTPEFGAASQLEKIDMLDFADVVAINKFERRGGADALRDVSRNWARGHRDQGAGEAPVFGTIASRFNDDGVTALYHALRTRLAEHGLAVGTGQLPVPVGRTSTSAAVVVPAERVRYLADVATAVRSYHATTATQAGAARWAQQVDAVRTRVSEGLADGSQLSGLARDAGRQVSATTAEMLEAWPGLAAGYAGDGAAADLWRESLSGTMIPRVSLPRFSDHGELVRWLRSEHLPGHFPFTAGVFPFKRQNEDPARMFAGEGDPARTNKRFHLLAEGQPATRLSTAFDSVTLYGRDPDLRPDIYGKVGTSGVSVATLQDMKTLYAGFDLCDPATSVSMTINGPAPTVLAMFLNVAIDQRVDRFEAEEGRQPSSAEAAELRSFVLSTVRGTVQADILKEDQGQNTCILSTDFALGMMADIAEWFVAQRVANFYSVSISGYHIAEAGANPISQLAFTLANGFTYVEAYLARGLAIDDFAPNLSFFFSNGMDPEYSVLGRVARRIWAIAMRDRYGASERGQKLKYHIQTSGRSLHAQEMAFNDIRTTLQALCAMYDNANSLHTNAYDEAVTTPSVESVRRALAIQLVISKEWGLSVNENPLQGSFIIEELTELVEAAVLAELDRLNDRGGVLGAMETGYQRGRIQDESMLYEQRKHDGSLPIVGVNTFTAPSGATPAKPLELARATEDEKRSQLEGLARFHAEHAHEAPGALQRLQDAALAGDNLFEVLMEAVRSCSLGQITEALFHVGGRYRRNT
jgi:methylmalonyl-CoA mutase